MSPPRSFVLAIMNFPFLLASGCTLFTPIGQAGVDCPSVGDFKNVMVIGVVKESPMEVLDSLRQKVTAEPSWGGLQEFQQGGSYDVVLWPVDEEKPKDAPGRIRQSSFLLKLEDNSNCCKVSLAWTVLSKGGQENKWVQDRDFSPIESRKKIKMWLAEIGACNGKQ